MFLSKTPEAVDIIYGISSLFRKVGSRYQSKDFQLNFVHSLSFARLN